MLLGACEGNSNVGHWMLYLLAHVAVNFDWLAGFYWHPTDTLDKTKGRMGPTSPRLSGLKEQSGTASWKGWVLEGKNPEWPWTAVPVARWFCSFPGTNPPRHHCSLPEGAAMDTAEKSQVWDTEKAKTKKGKPLTKTKSKNVMGAMGTTGTALQFQLKSCRKHNFLLPLQKCWKKNPSL